MASLLPDREEALIPQWA